MSNMPEMEPEMKWEEPDRDQRKAERMRVPYTDALKARPGVWALVEEKASFSSSVDSWKRLGCEATSRLSSDNTFKIYARWPEQ